MTDKQEEKYGMGLKVEKFLDTEWSLFGALPQFPPQRTLLQNLLKEIVKQDVIITSDMSGYTAQKNATRDKLEDATKKVSDSLLSYGAGNSDPYIIEEEEYLASALSQASDSELYVLSVLLWRKADPVKASLPPYGSDPADVALVATLAESFLTQMRVPFANRKARSRAVARLKEHFSELDTVLKTLDALLKVYQYVNEPLYSRYRSARNINNVIGGHKVHKKTGRVLAGFVAPALFTAKALKGVKQFVFYNESKKGLKLGFYFSAQAGGHPQRNSKMFIIDGGEKSAVTIADSGYSPATAHLNIYNPNARTGKWKAEVKKEMI